MVPTAIATQAAFATNPHVLQLLGPYGNNNPDTVQYHTLQVMYMPHKYINLFLG